MKNRKLCTGLIIELQKHQISFPELGTLAVAKLAATDPGFQAVLVDMLATSTKLDAGQIERFARYRARMRKPMPHLRRQGDSRAGEGSRSCRADGCGC